MSAHRVEHTHTHTTLHSIILLGVGGESVISEGGGGFEFSVGFPGCVCVCFCGGLPRGDLGCRWSRPGVVVFFGSGCWPSRGGGFTLGAGEGRGVKTLTPKG